MEFFAQPISKLSFKIRPEFPSVLESSAFRIFILSPLYIKNAPGNGYKPLILPIIFFAVSLFQEILPSDLSIFLA